jgi:hypothetical protein
MREYCAMGAMMVAALLWPSCMGSMGSRGATKAMCCCSCWDVCTQQIAPQNDSWLLTFHRYATVDVQSGPIRILLQQPTVANPITRFIRARRVELDTMSLKNENCQRQGNQQKQGLPSRAHNHRPTHSPARFTSYQVIMFMYAFPESYLYLGLDSAVLHQHQGQCMGLVQTPFLQGCAFVWK